MKLRRSQVRNAIAYTLGALSILLVITGLGITRAGIITPLTLGLLGKAASYQIHLILWGPFLVLLLIHMSFNVLWKKNKKVESIPADDRD